jgi:hypothetical protein
MFGELLWYSVSVKYGWIERMKVPADLHVAIKAEAKKENRRITEQVKYILTQWYRAKLSIEVLDSKIGEE